MEIGKLRRFKIAHSYFNLYKNVYKETIGKKEVSYMDGVVLWIGNSGVKEKLSFRKNIHLRWRGVFR